jgi:hypothetical protein
MWIFTPPFKLFFVAPGKKMAHIKTGTTKKAWSAKDNLRVPGFFLTVELEGTEMQHRFSKFVFKTFFVRGYIFIC